MLKPGKYNTNNFQAVCKSWKRHHSRSISEQSVYHVIKYFHCSVPAKKWKYCHSQHYRNKLNSKDIKTMRNSNYKHFFVLFLQAFKQRFT